MQQGEETNPPLADLTEATGHRTGTVMGRGPPTRQPEGDRETSTPGSPTARPQQVAAAAVTATAEPRMAPALAIMATKAADRPIEGPRQQLGVAMDRLTEDPLAMITFHRLTRNGGGEMTSTANRGRLLISS